MIHKTFPQYSNLSLAEHLFTLIKHFLSNKTCQVCFCLHSKQQLQKFGSYFAQNIRYYKKISVSLYKSISKIKQSIKLL